MQVRLKNSKIQPSEEGRTSVNSQPSSTVPAQHLWAAEPAQGLLAEPLEMRLQDVTLKLNWCEEKMEKPTGNGQSQTRLTIQPTGNG